MQNGPLSRKPYLDAIVRALMDTDTPQHPQSNFSGSTPPAWPSVLPPAPPFSWMNVNTPAKLGNWPALPAIRYAPVKRFVYFAFHYDDILRANNVRLSPAFQQGSTGVSARFVDRSLWERRKRTDPDGLKRLMREGVQGSSVVCVLIGSATWQRRWVRYEIARAVVDQKGLLGVDINGLNHHRELSPHPMGYNPLDFMGVGQIDDGTYRICEWTDGWRRYPEFTAPVQLPRYLASPGIGYVSALSSGTARYDYAGNNGSKALGMWADIAARSAGRK